jgi:hypothetical protein
MMWNQRNNRVRKKHGQKGRDTPSSEDGSIAWRHDLVRVRIPSESTHEIARLDHVAFPLELRIPAWSSAATVRVNGKAQPGVQKASFYAIRRVWKDGDRVTVDLPADFGTSRWINQSVSVERGPLVFSLALEERQVASQPGGDLGLGLTPQPGFSELEIRSQNPWRYALMLDPESPGASLALATRPMPENPFVQATTPVYVSAKAKLLSYWGMDSAHGNLPAEPPFPAVSTGATVDVQLVPFGAENIRVTYFPLAIAEGARFEAESGVFGGGAVSSSDHPGFSGSGFCDFKGTNGANVRIPLHDVEAGLHYLTIRYAAGAGASSTTRVFVNDEALPLATLAGTGTWDAWADSPPLPVALKAGENAVQVTNEDGAPINVDYVSISPFQGSFLEGEGATLSGGAVVMSDHPRYTGAGFVDFKATDGASATFFVKARSAGPHSLIVRYAAGQGATVNGMKLYVNGQLAALGPFPATGSWRIWQNSDPQIITLVAGGNTLKFVNTSAPFMNIDAITVLPSAELPCLRALPSVSIAPPFGSVTTHGGKVSYTVRVHNDDSEACPSAVFHVEASALGLAGARVSFAGNDLTIAPGQDANIVLTVEVPANASPATYLGYARVRNDPSAKSAIATFGVEVP